MENNKNKKSVNNENKSNIEKEISFENKKENMKNEGNGNEHFKESIKLKVFRMNAVRETKKDSPHYDEFQVPVKRWTTVLDALLHAKSYQDSSIGIRYSCRMATC